MKKKREWLVYILTNFKSTGIDKVRDHAIVVEKPREQTHLLHDPINAWPDDARFHAAGGAYHVAQAIKTSTGNLFHVIELETGFLVCEMDTASFNVHAGGYIMSLTYLDDFIQRIVEEDNFDKQEAA